MQVESSKSRLRGLPRAFHLPFRQAIICRERFQTVPYDVRRNKPAACFDTGKDEGNPAKRGTDGRFSAA